MPSFSLSLEKIQQANLIRGKTQDTHTHTHHKSTKLKPIISKPKTNKLNNAQTKQYEISPHTQRNLQNYQWVDFVLATAARHVALPLRDFYVLSESSGRRLIFSVQVVVSWIASWLGMNLYAYFFSFQTLYKWYHIYYSSVPVIFSLLWFWCVPGVFSYW